MNLLEIQKSLNAYLAATNIELEGDPRPFAVVADDWQQRDTAAIAPAIEKLINPKAPDPTQRRCWWVRPRGHSKTADAAMLVARVLAFSRRRRRGVWIAADKDQGCEGLDAIATFCRHNSWLADLLTIRADKVENRRTESVLYFTTSDVSSAFGWKDCDLFVLDELTHWKTNGEQLWTAMYSAAGKRKGAVLFALMNAGFDGWQRDLRNIIQRDPSWCFSELPDAVASWIDRVQLEDQRRYLPAIAFDRLWRNRWSSGGGDALTPEDIAAAFQDNLQPMTGNEQDHYFAGGVDLGLVRDCSAVVVLAVPKGGLSGRIRLAHAKLWRPTLGQKIDLTEIESHVLDLDERFGLEFVGFDPWQMEHLAQRLEAHSRHRRRNQRRRWAAKPWMREVPPSAPNLRAQATLTIESFQDHRLLLFPYEPLRRDLLKLRVEEKSYGVRLTSPHDGEGHGDTASAFMLALLVAHELAGKNPLRVFSLLDSSPGNWQGELAAFEARRAADLAEREYLQREYQGESKRLAAQAIYQHFNR
jgi:hypothetical protein